MTMEHRADLTGADKAVSEVLDEINVRMHGLMSSGSFHREFLDWLAERGYSITPSAGSPDTGQAREPVMTETTRKLARRVTQYRRESLAWLKQAIRADGEAGAASNALIRERQVAVLMDGDGYVDCAIARSGDTGPAADATEHDRAWCDVCDLELTSAQAQEGVCGEYHRGVRDAEAGADVGRRRNHASSSSSADTGQAREPDEPTTAAGWGEHDGTLAFLRRASWTTHRAGDPEIPDAAVSAVGALWTRKLHAITHALIDAGWAPRPSGDTVQAPDAAASQLQAGPDVGVAVQAPDVADETAVRVPRVYLRSWAEFLRALVQQGAVRATNAIDATRANAVQIESWADRPAPGPVQASNVVEVIDWPARFHVAATAARRREWDGTAHLLDEVAENLKYCEGDDADVPEVVALALLGTEGSESRG